MGNSGLDGAISPTGVAFLEGEGAISPDTAKNPTPYSLVVCAQLCPICPARGWGVIWLVISLGLWAGGVCYLVLHVGGHLDF